jgi:hypothetical protein
MPIESFIMCVLMIIPGGLYVLISLYHIWVKGILRRVKCHAFKIEDVWILNKETSPGVFTR